MMQSILFVYIKDNYKNLSISLDKELLLVSKPIQIITMQKTYLKDLFSFIQTFIFIHTKPNTYMIYLSSELFGSLDTTIT